MQNENLDIIYFGAGCFWCVEAIFQQVNGVEKVVCTEGQKVPVGLDTYTVERQNNKCGIFLVKTEVIDGEIVETLILKCEEGQFV